MLVVALPYAHPVGMCQPFMYIGKFDTDVQLLALPIHCHSLSSLITQTCWKWE